MVDLRSGLVGEWLFDGNANDTSGNGNDGTVSGATLTQDNLGRNNRAYLFNTTSNKITTGLTDDFTSFSTEYFFYWTGGAAFGRLWDKRTSSGQTHLCFLRTDDNTLRYEVDYSTTSSEQLYTLAKNTLYHIVITHENMDSDTSQAKLYVNGKEVSFPFNITPSGTILYNDDAYVIGNRGTDNARYFNGTIYHVRMWNRSLSAEEVSQLYNDIKPQYQDLFENCVGYWDLSNDAKELIQQFDGTITGATLTTGRFGETNGAYLFTTQDDYIYAGSHSTEYSMSASQDFTFASWFKHDGTQEDPDGGDGFSVFRNQTNSGTSNIYCTRINDSTGGTAGRMKFILRSNGGTAYTVESGATTGDLRDDEWHLCICKRVGSTIYISIDGTDRQSTSATSGAITANNLYFGAFNDIDDFEEVFRGKLGEQILWKRALSDDEELLLYDLMKNKKVYPFIRGVKD